MLDPQKTLEPEALLKRIRELQAETAQHERNLPGGEARLPIEEQLTLKRRRFIEANIPELAGKVRVGIHRKYSCLPDDLIEAEYIRVRSTQLSCDLARALRRITNVQPYAAINMVVGQRWRVVILSLFCGGESSKSCRLDFAFEFD